MLTVDWNIVRKSFRIYFVTLDISGSAQYRLCNTENAMTNDVVLQQLRTNGCGILVKFL